jgi:hypothetical protein
MKHKTLSDGYDSSEQDDPEDTAAPEIGEPNRSLTHDSRTRHSFLAEDQGEADAEDDNLSDLYASMGVEERLDELGM